MFFLQVVGECRGALTHRGLRAEAPVSGSRPCDFGEMGSGLSVPVSAWARPGQSPEPRPVRGRETSHGTGTGGIHGGDRASPPVQRPPWGDTVCTLLPTCTSAFLEQTSVRPQRGI